MWRAPDGRVPVCWENPSAEFADAMEWVRDSVRRTWEAESNLRFVGWEQCPQGAGPGQGIRIQVADSGAHVKALGSRLDGVRNGMVLNFTFANWSRGCQSSREECVRKIAVHEFGHAIGFAHEHNKGGPEACQAEAQGTDGDWSLVPYDLNSIMNYCRDNYGGTGWQLSDGDKKSVRSVYPVFTEAAPQTGRSFQLITRQSGVCLHVQNQSPADRNHLMQWKCQDTEEFWFSVERQNDGFYRLRSNYPNRCFHVRTGVDQSRRAPLWQWTCGDSDEFKFKFDYAGKDNWGQDWYRIRAKNGVCFHILGGPTADARHYMASWECVNGPEFLVHPKYR